MKAIYWDLSKSEELKSERGASFEDLLNQGQLVAIKKHPKRENQDIMLFEFKDYIWVVPFVKEKSGIIFLKTLFPSRKYTKIIKEEKP